jgi:hypothetical protein
MALAMLMTPRSISMIDGVFAMIDGVSFTVRVVMIAIAETVPHISEVIA